jgi:hypothetical protein
MHRTFIDGLDEFHTNKVGLRPPLARSNDPDNAGVSFFARTGRT